MPDHSTENNAGSRASYADAQQASRRYYADADDRGHYQTYSAASYSSERPGAYGGLDDGEHVQRLVDDSIPVMGIVIGGALGYLAALMIGGNRPEGRSARRRSGRFGGESSCGYFSRGRAAGPSRSVEREETTDLIASDKVEGTAVYNRQGEKLGEVYNFMVGKRSGQVAYAVMSFGGFLGIGQKYHLLPWSALTYDTSRGGYVIDADKDRLMGAPSYQSWEEPFSRPNYGRQVQDYWSSNV